VKPPRKGGIYGIKKTEKDKKCDQGEEAKLFQEKNSLP
jgi:hypothetical protein